MRLQRRLHTSYMQPRSLKPRASTEYEVHTRMPGYQRLVPTSTLPLFRQEEPGESVNHALMGPFWFVEANDCVVS